MNRPDQHRNPAIDLARIVAAILVVLVHASTGQFHAGPARLGWVDWEGVCFLASAARVCVPLFFLITGFLLLKPGLDCVEFYRRRIPRIALPLLAWSVVYWFVRLSWEGSRISPASALRLLYNGEIYFHLWFIYALLGVYLMVPFVGSMLERDGTRLLRAYALITVVVCSVVPFWDRLASGSIGQTFSFGVPPGGFWIYAGYAAIGALLREGVFSRVPRGWLAVAAICSVVGTFGLTTMDCHRAGGPSERYFGYGQPLVLLAAVAVFEFLRRCSFGPRVSPMLAMGSSWTFGVYLAHPLVMRALEKGGIRWPDNGCLSTVVQLCIVTVLSVSLTIALSAMPIMRRAVS